jgi:hypothetical protein
LERACVSRVAEVAEIEAAKVLVQKEAWTSLFMIEQLQDTAGTSWFMEFNGRFWGSAALARRCGLDIPNWQRKKLANFRTFTRSEAPEIRPSGFLQPVRLHPSMQVPFPRVYIRGGMGAHAHLHV